jgi:hypothetical protein
MLLPYRNKLTSDVRGAERVCSARHLRASCDDPRSRFVRISPARNLGSRQMVESWNSTRTTYQLGSRSAATITEPPSRSKTIR